MTLETLVPFVPVLFGIAALLVSLAILGLREMMSLGVTHFAVLVLGAAAFVVAIINFGAYAAIVGVVPAVGFVLTALLAGVAVPFTALFVNGRIEDAQAVAAMDY